MRQMRPSLNIVHKSSVQVQMLAKPMKTRSKECRLVTSELLHCIANGSNIYRVVFLTGPPDFQYQNEKTCSATEELLKH